MCKTYCDRCGQQFKYGDKVDLMKNTVKSPYDTVLVDIDNRRIDICPECQEQLNALVEDFMKGANV